MKKFESEFRILSLNQKMNNGIKLWFSFSILKLKNEKREKSKILLVFKTKIELYFRYTDYGRIMRPCMRVVNVHSKSEVNIIEN